MEEDFHGANAARGAASYLRRRAIKCLVIVAVFIGLVWGCTALVF